MTFLHIDYETKPRELATPKSKLKVVIVQLGTMPEKMSRKIGKNGSENRIIAFTPQTFPYIGIKTRKSAPFEGFKEHNFFMTSKMHNHFTGKPCLEAQKSKTFEKQDFYQHELLGILMLRKKKENLTISNTLVKFSSTVVKTAYA